MTENLTEGLEKVFKTETEILDIVPTEKTLTPLFDRVLVEPIKEKVHELLLEEITGSEPTRGLVTAVGDEVRAIKVGEEVLFKQYQADEIEDGALLIFQERNLLGVWR